MTHLTPNAASDNTETTEVPESHDIVSFIYDSAQANMQVIIQMTDGAELPWKN